MIFFIIPPFGKLINKYIYLYLHSEGSRTAGEDCLRVNDTGWTCTVDGVLCSRIWTTSGLKRPSETTGRGNSTISFCAPELKLSADFLVKCFSLGSALPVNRIIIYYY